MTDHCGDPALFAQDILDDGEPEGEFVKGIASSLPRKSVAAGALIRDEAGRVLFVSPIYKPFLEIPGGLTEDDESPLAACGREVREELGIYVHIGRLLVVDWMPTHGLWRDSMQLIFDGGVLDADQTARIRLQTDEISQFEFLDLDKAKTRLRPSKARRIELAYRAMLDGETIYGEFGRR